jgi:formate hydrogenlyase subunit 6/NADH:ubiquinone oxidoreductase subunit I
LYACGPACSLQSGEVHAMKTILYYFTGTGNSLAAARTLAAVLGDCTLVPIASLDPAGGVIVPQADRVGILCPVYFAGLPVMVAGFAARLDLSRAKYSFAVVTYGGSGGSSALRQLDDILTARNGRGLDAGFPVKMPGNYILMYGSPAGTKREKMLAMAGEQLAEIARAVSQCGKQKLPSSLFAGLIHALAYPRFASHVHEDDRKFTVSAACTSCGTCARICPAANIELVEGRPVWLHHCELCCGCIHLCPVGAIQAGGKTENRVRYRNPSVTLQELEKNREPVP